MSRLPLPPTHKQANERRRLDEHRRPGATGKPLMRVVKRKPPKEPREEIPREPKASKKTPRGRNGGLARHLKATAKGRRQAQAAERAADQPRPANPPSAPPLPPGEDWPTRRECCWPTSDGRPWTFCRAPVAAESLHGYCADHHSDAFKKSSPGGQIDARDMSERRGAFILPHGSGDPRKGALASSVKARSAKVSTTS